MNARMTISTPENLQEAKRRLRKLEEELPDTEGVRRLLQELEAEYLTRKSELLMEMQEVFEREGPVDIEFGRHCLERGRRPKGKRRETDKPVR